MVKSIERRLDSPGERLIVAARPSLYLARNAKALPRNKLIVAAQRSFLLELAMLKHCLES
jgi:uncharacterized membrane protein YczE